jgi:hypothetical protein
MLQSQQFGRLLEPGLRKIFHGNLQRNSRTVFTSI